MPPRRPALQWVELRGSSLPVRQAPPQVPRVPRVPQVPQVVQVVMEHQLAEVQYPRILI